MAFQIAYVFEAIDKFTKVAAKIEKSIDDIEGKIKLGKKSFDDYGKIGRKALLNVDKGSSKAERGFEKLNRRQQKTNRLMATMGSSAGNLRSRLVGLAVGTAIGGFGFAKGMEKSLDFQDALIDLEVITGATGKDLDILKNKAFSMGKQFGTSGAEIATGMKLVASAKPELLKNIPALAELTRQTLLLKTAAGMEMPEATKALVGALNIYGKGVKDASKFVNILAAGAKFGSSEIKDTTQAIIRGGASAEAAGVGFVKLNALIQGLARSELKGAKAGTALNTLLTRLQRAGFDFKRQGLAEIFLKIRKELEASSTPQQRVNKEVVLFGLHHKKAGLALVKNAEMLDVWEKKLTGTNVAQEQSDVRLKRFRTSLEKIGTTLEEKLFALFEKIEPVLLKATEKIGNFIETIDDKRIKDMANAISTLVAALTLLADILDVLLTPFKLFSDIFTLSPTGLPSNLAERSAAMQEAIKSRNKEKISLLPEGTSKEAGKATKAADSKVALDINLKGNTEAVSSVQLKSEGAVVANVGQNLAFIG